MAWRLASYDLSLVAEPGPVLFARKRVGDYVQPVRRCSACDWGV